ncbi:unnamed protein product [Rotaria sp. Silwood1]|nr:unnamed protein product [Rotaria sp. Silwood1]CAF1606775.1 unnamed protein product [Rotaria sp. Silwood1]
MTMSQVKLEQPRDNDQSIPQTLQWMPSPGLANPLPNMPLGLQYLAHLDTLMALQEPSVVQTITGLASAQRFQILNEQGQLVFYAVEDESDTCHRWCCGANRAFVIHVFDQMNQEIIRISREFKCCVGCCWCASANCCAHEAFIESPPGVNIGTVRQTRSCWRGHLSLRDAGGNEHLRVIGPCCICQGIYAGEGNDETELGAIYKEYAGFVNQAFTGAEKYTIKFPMSLPVPMKAVALGALFLVNFMYFAGNADQKGGSSILSLLG